jgi:hypothetical protein
LKTGIRIQGAGKCKDIHFEKGSKKTTETDAIFENIRQINALADAGAAVNSFSV